MTPLGQENENKKQNVDVCVSMCIHSNLPNIMHVATKSAHDIKEVCSVNMDVW